MVGAGHDSPLFVLARHCQVQQALPGIMRQKYHRLATDLAVLNIADADVARVYQHRLRLAAVGATDELLCDFQDLPLRRVTRVESHWSVAENR